MIFQAPSRFAEAKAEDMAESRKPQAVLVPFPAQGHINPMMHLARQLVHEGFLVGFVTTDYNHSRIVKANNFRSYGEDIRFLVVADGLPPTDTRTDIAKMCHITEQVIASFVDKIIAKMMEEDEESQVCLVTDALASVALDIAKRHQIPRAVLWTSLTATYAILYNLPSLVSTAAVLPTNGVPKDFKAVKYLPYMPPLYSAHLPWVPGFTESQQEFIFHFMNRYMERVREIKWVLFNTFHGLEAPVIDGLVSQGASICPIGPFIPSHFLNEDVHAESNDETPTGFWSEEEGCLEWLDKQSAQSVIFIAFGSLTVLNEAQLVELALGLQATQRPFLWVVRNDLLDGSTAVFPPGFLEATKKQGYLVSWCPQLRVLSHSSIACFITHCGWNSVVESVSMGVPMVCWPYFADQFLNRDYVVNVWKVGLPLNAISDGIIQCSEIQRTVERTMTGEEGLEMKRRMVELRKRAKDAIKEKGSSFTQFREFLNAMVNRDM